MLSKDDKELEHFPDMTLDEQISFYESHANPAMELLRVSESVPHEFLTVRGTQIDKRINKVKIGNIVMIEYDITRGLGTQSHDSYTKLLLSGYPEELSHLAYKDMRLPEVALQARKDLLELVLASDATGEPSRFNLIYGVSPVENYRKCIVGIVDEPPSPFNEGALKMQGYIGIDSDDIRLLHIVGVNSTVANTPRTTAQVGDRVKVHYNDRWYPATITSTSWLGNISVGVRCDDKIHDGNYDEGHGLTVSVNPECMRSLHPRFVIHKRYG